MREIGCAINIEHLPERVFDVRYNVLDTTKLQEHTGWHPEVEFVNGLVKTRDWLMGRLG
jgi:nucleoside-diphosphate-sugar epimerase